MRVQQRYGAAVGVGGRARAAACTGRPDALICSGRPDASNSLIYMNKDLSSTHMVSFKVKFCISYVMLKMHNGFFINIFDSE